MLKTIRLSQRLRCVLKNTKQYSSENMARVLNVAEKNDAAKSLSEIMSNGHYDRKNGLSPYNKIYEFDYQLWNRKCRMIMTSVSGHILNNEFEGSYKIWHMCNPVTLFEAPIVLVCEEQHLKIKQTLEREASRCSKLIIWTDGDREGENIGFEIIKICKDVNPNLEVFRARFSEITRQAISRACQNLVAPDQNVNNAVEVRRELDLRIGAAFTRLQTMRLQKVFPDVLSNNVISYGSCQFPTMGFVIDRYKQIQNFTPEPFWKIEVTHAKDGLTVNFAWNRHRLFNHWAAAALYSFCMLTPLARVEQVTSKNKSKWRPLPLDTVEMEKLASRKLRLTAKATMTIAENLYTKGFISYPRTETNMFAKEIDLAGLVQLQTADPQWGQFASGILTNGPNPRNGTKTDNAHPPIHPIKYTNTLAGDDKRVYEFIVRHFLACLSKDALGMETVVEISIGFEKFTAKGLLILERNYLDVYPYDKWSDKEIPSYQEGEEFEPSSITLEEGSTTAPPLLTEADLISLMEKHGIGTDATHADHIERIKFRLYVGLNEESRFVPGELGIGLADGYDSMGLEMTKPRLRSGLEIDLKKICEGHKDHQIVLQEQITLYKDIFIKAQQQGAKIDLELVKYFGQAVPHRENDPELSLDKTVMKCPKCKSGNIVLRKKKNGPGFYLTCMTFPNCKSSIWFPEYALDMRVSDELCASCTISPVYKLTFKINQGGEITENTACFNGCDNYWLDHFDVRPIPRLPDPQPAISNRPNRRVQASNNVVNQGDGNGRPAQRNRTNQGTNLIGTWLNASGPSSASSTTASGTGSSRRSVPVDENVKCECGLPAIPLTTKKEGPNLGRVFLKCAKPQPDSCRFFKWQDEIGLEDASDIGRNIRASTSAIANNTDDQNALKCTCGGIAKLLTVQKETANKGKQFYACRLPQAQGCGFFKWADEVDC